MCEPFSRRNPSSGIVGRILRAPRRQSAIAELEDLLARARRVRDVQPAQVTRVASERGVDLERGCRTARCTLYRRYLEHCLTDQQLSDEEHAELAHLQRVLQLSDDDVAEIHDRVTRDLYGHAVEEVLEDHRIDPEEQRFLARLRDQLALPEPVAASLLEEGSQQARRRFIDRAAAPQHVFVAPTDRVLELKGSSAESLEAAIRDALAPAARAVEELRWFEVTRLGGTVGSGGLAEWRVEVRAGFGEPPGELRG